MSKLLKVLGMRSVSSWLADMPDAGADIRNTEQLVIQHFSNTTSAVECKHLSTAIADVQKKSQECNFKKPVFRNKAANRETSLIVENTQTPVN